MGADLSPVLAGVLWFMGSARVALGMAPFLAAGLSARLMGFPVEQDNASARLMARLFGVRDVGLGVLVFWGLASHHELLVAITLFNAGTDSADLVAITMAYREGIVRAAWTSAAFAGSAGLLWLAVCSQLP